MTDPNDESEKPVAWRRRFKRMTGTWTEWDLIPEVAFNLTYPSPTCETQALYPAPRPSPVSPEIEGLVDELLKSRDGLGDRLHNGTPALRAWKAMGKAASALALLTPKPAPEIEGLVERLWQDLLDKDDRTSPAIYPDMALIAFDEFKAALSEAAIAQRDLLSGALMKVHDWIANSYFGPDEMAEVEALDAVVLAALQKGEHPNADE